MIIFDICYHAELGNWEKGRRRTREKTTRGSTYPVLCKIFFCSLPGRRPQNSCSCVLQMILETILLLIIFSGSWWDIVTAANDGECSKTSTLDLSFCSLSHTHAHACTRTRTHIHTHHHCPKVQKPNSNYSFLAAVSS